MKQTTLCYLERNGQYLMLHRVKKANDASHDKWIGVGGKCELAVTSWRYRGIVTFISDIWPCEYMHLFTADRWNSGVLPANEGDATSLVPELPDCNEGVLEWIDKERLFDLTLWPGDRIFLRLIMDPRQPFFSLKLVYKGDDLVEAKLDGRPLAL